ncbi:MAG: hypothetical protein JHC93_07035 [Parachlamydiales bacterium]|nr:hypothetical protein [Parachlamydiales bacterium]
MTTTITLKSISADNHPIIAKFLPFQGMNLISYKKGNIEVIDQTTQSLFDERYAGLGALIGPHFHHRQADQIPPIADESLFEHIAKIKENGGTEFFSHGIARYAPWTYDSNQNSISARICGSDTWHDVPLKDLEGFDFEMKLNAQVTPLGLAMHLSVKAEKPSIVGLHYYYGLAFRKGVISGLVQDQYRTSHGLEPIPKEWYDKESGMLKFPVDSEADFGFFPRGNGHTGKMTLETTTHKLNVDYTAGTHENSFQIYHPAKSSYVCIEPLTAKNPRDLKINESSMAVKIAIDLL